MLMIGTEEIEGVEAVVKWDIFLTRGVRVRSLHELIRLAFLVGQRFVGMTESEFHALPGYQGCYFTKKNYLSGVTSYREKVEYYRRMTGWSERKIRDYLTTLYRVVFHLWL